jgi:hypothetical protein
MKFDRLIGRLNQAAADKSFSIKRVQALIQR